MDFWMRVQPQALRYVGSGSESDTHFREKLRRAFFMWWEDVMAEQDVFIVSERAPEDEPRPITLHEKDALYAPGATIQEQLVAASVFAKIGKFPGHVTSRIFEFVGFMLTFEVETEQQRGGQSNMNETYVDLAIPSVSELHLPRGVSIGRCVNLSAECCSHDQGWATFDREHNGTYIDSYTWSEVAAFTTNEDNELTEIARETISKNLRARNYFRHHCKQFRDPMGFAQHVVPGSQVQLVLRSQYPGWTNTAKFGRLRAQFALTIDEDFEFYSWPKIQQLLPTLHRGSHTESWCTIQ